MQSSEAKENGNVQKVAENGCKSQILTSEDGYEISISKTNVVEISSDQDKKPTNFQSELQRVQIQKKSASQQSLEILRNPHFILLLVNILLFLFGCSVVFTHIIAFAESQGISPSLGRLLVSILGGAGIAGRVGLSGLSQLPCTNTIVLYCVAVALTGKLVQLAKVGFLTRKSGTYDMDKVNNSLYREDRANL